VQIIHFLEQNVYLEKQKEL